MEETPASRNSRYLQHCQGKTATNADHVNSEQPTKTNANQNETVNTLLRGISSRSPSLNKKINILKNSLSSSRDSTPAIKRLSRSGTPTPLLQSVAVGGGMRKSPEHIERNIIAHESANNGMNDFSQKQKPSERHLSDSRSLKSVASETNSANKNAPFLNKNSIKLLNDLNGSVNNLPSSNGVYDKLNNNNINEEAQHTADLNGERCNSVFNEDDYSNVIVSSKEFRTLDYCTEATTAQNEDIGA